MGKGDKKTRKGKITMGSYGVKRPRKKSHPIHTASKKITVSKEVPVIAKAVEKKEAAPKKAVAKKETVAKKTTEKKSVTAKKTAPKKAKKNE